MIVSNYAGKRPTIYFNDLGDLSDKFDKHFNQNEPFQAFQLRIPKTESCTPSTL